MCRLACVLCYAYRHAASAWLACGYLSIKCGRFTSDISMVITHPSALKLCRTVNSATTTTRWNIFIDYLYAVHTYLTKSRIQNLKSIAPQSLPDGQAIIQQRRQCISLLQPCALPPPVFLVNIHTIIVHRTVYMRYSIRCGPGAVHLYTLPFGF